MKNIKELKENVDLRMKRCWGENCALFFIALGGLIVAFFAVYITVNFLVATGEIESITDLKALGVAAAIFLVVWVIAVPYHYGERWYRLQQIRGHSVHAKSIFSCYFSVKRLFQVYKLSTLLFLKRSVIRLPFAILICLTGYHIIKLDEVESSTGYNLAVVVLIMLAVVSFIAYTIINFKYAAVPYIFALGFDRPAKEIIKESARFTRNKLGYLIHALMNCAFMLIPCIAVFPTAFVVSRVMMIYTAVINEVIEDGFAADKLVVTERRD